MAADLTRLLATVLLLLGAHARADDPTRPPAQLLDAPRPAAGSPAAPDPLQLQAVMQTPGKPPGAMINGWVMRPGDSVHGVRLAAVGRQHADVVVNGERLRLSLTPGVTRRPVADPAAAVEPARRPATPNNSSRGTPR